MADRLHQVSLAHSNPDIEEQGVVGLRWALGNGARGGMRKLISAADDKGVKGVFGTQLRGSFPIEARLRCAGAGDTGTRGRCPSGTAAGAGRLNRNRLRRGTLGHD